MLFFYSSIFHFLNPQLSILYLNQIVEFIKIPRYLFHSTFNQRRPFFKITRDSRGRDRIVQLAMESVYITTDVVSSIPDHAMCARYNICDQGCR